MSRAPHEPTSETRNQVRSLAAVGLPHDDIGAIVDCSPKTLRKYYQLELEEGAADANAAVVGFLMKSVKDGSVPAMIFYEKCLGGRRETVREECTLLAAPYVDPVLPCNGKGPCPRWVGDYEPGDENLPPTI
jgi:hypothetical protein